MRCLGFAKRTINDKRIIRANRTDTLFIWVDAAHAVHSNMRGHTGGCISMGLRIIHGRFVTQKINTRSTIESELVGVSKYLPYDLWYMLLFET